MILCTVLTTLGLLAVSNAQATQGTLPSDLVGTWSTKSNQTLTGPGFYDPLNDVLKEPLRTGISYSFTADGFYEEAYYRAIANPTSPECPAAIMQWQHGTWVMNANHSLTLTPIAVDGRQLLSEPCLSKNSVYTRYNQSEYFQRYSVYTDPYHGIPRLDMFRFDGSPLQPLYIRFKPPNMLPTTTLNPLKSASATAAPTHKAKRGLDQEIPAQWLETLKQPETMDIIQRIDTDRLWWIGVSLTGIGGLLYLGPRRFGLRL